MLNQATTWPKRRCTFSHATTWPMLSYMFYQATTWPTPHVVLLRELVRAITIIFKRKGILTVTVEIPPTLTSVPIHINHTTVYLGGRIDEAVATTCNIGFFGGTLQSLASFANVYFHRQFAFSTTILSLLISLP